MGFISVATQRFDAMADFYRDTLGGQILKQWDRVHARGMLLDLGGLRLEIMDATRERNPPTLNDPDGRFHLVIEVADIMAHHRMLPAGTPHPQPTSWGADLVSMLDPDGLRVCLLQWHSPENPSSDI